MNTFKGPLIAVVAALLTVFATDALEFHSIQANNYSTPWYSNSFVLHPYTYLQTHLRTSTVSWTKNVVGDDWKVRETTINGKTWWTVLEKHPKELRS